MQLFSMTYNQKELLQQIFNQIFFSPAGKTSTPLLICMLTLKKVSAFFGNEVELVTSASLISSAADVLRI